MWRKPLLFGAALLLTGILLWWLFGRGELANPRANFTPNLEAKLSQKIYTATPLSGATVGLASLSAIPHYLVFNLDSGKIYAARGESERISPASFTKLLSGQVALDLGFPDQIITATRTSVDKVPTVLGLLVGEQLTLTDLLRAAIATSANDAAATLTEGLASQNGIGSADFIDLMNKKAALLLMTDSHFANPDGLDDPSQYSTLMDIAKLVINTYKSYPEIASASAADRADIKEGPTHGFYYLPNWNGLLGVYPGVFGGKIAYTEIAGYGTIVLAERNGVRLAALATGANSIPERDLAAAALLDAGFIAEKIAPVRLKKAHFVPRYKQWSDLAKYIRAQLAAGGK